MQLLNNSDQHLLYITTLKLIT